MSTKAYREAHREEINAYRDTHREERRTRDRTRARPGDSLRRNGWTVTAWSAAFALQGGRCAIVGCDRPIEASDHDHSTGLRRELLCRPCNSALTHHMTPALLRALADYLEKHSADDPRLALWDQSA